MANLSQVKVGSTTYDIKDTTARNTFANYLPLAGGTVTGNVFSTGAHIGFKNGLEADKFFDFGYADPTASTAPGASWRIAALNSGSGDTNYFVIQTGGSATDSTTWSNAIRLGMNTLDAAFGGNVYPTTNNTKTLGTSSLKWSTVYATTFSGKATSAGTADSASDSSKLNGYASDTAASNNTIARRTANGYINATYFNQSSGAETPTTSSYIMYANSDGYLRKSSLANIKTILGLGSNAYTSTAYVAKAGDTMTGDLALPNLKATTVVCANTANSGSAGGLALYGTSPTDYGIAFRQTSNGSKHGGVQGDWAQYHYMAGATNRGWVFKAAGSNVASIDGLGDAVFNGYVTIGGNAANSSGCKQQYNTTTQALDFIFS